MISEGFLKSKKLRALKDDRDDWAVRALFFGILDATDRDGLFSDDLPEVWSAIHAHFHCSCESFAAAVARMVEVGLVLALPEHGCYHVVGFHEKQGRATKDGGLPDWWLKSAPSEWNLPPTLRQELGMPGRGDESRHVATRRDNVATLRRHRGDNGSQVEVEGEVEEKEKEKKDPPPPSRNDDAIDPAKYPEGEPDRIIRCWSLYFDRLNARRAREGKPHTFKPGSDHWTAQRAAADGNSLHFTDDQLVEEMGRLCRCLEVGGYTETFKAVCSKIGMVWEGNGEDSAPVIWQKQERDGRAGPLAKEVAAMLPRVPS